MKLKQDLAAQGKQKPSKTSEELEDIGKQDIQILPGRFSFITMWADFFS